VALDLDPGFFKLFFEGSLFFHCFGLECIKHFFSVL